MLSDERPLNGFTINICAVAVFAFICLTIDDCCNFSRAPASPNGLPVNNPPPLSAAYSREREIAIWSQVMYDIGDWTLAARYDWYDPDSGAKDADMFRYTGALNYHFAENVVAKAEYNRNELESGEDYNEAIFSIVVAIGDL